MDTLIYLLLRVYRVAKLNLNITAWILHTKQRIFAPTQSELIPSLTRCGIHHFCEHILRFFDTNGRPMATNKKLFGRQEMHQEHI